MGGEGETRWKYRVKTVVAVYHKSRKSGVPTSRLPLRKKITDQLSDQAGGRREKSYGAFKDLLAIDTSEEEEMEESGECSTLTEEGQNPQAETPQKVPSVCQSGGLQDFLSYSGLVPHQAAEELR